MTSFGPDGDIPLKINKFLAQTLRSHTKYVANLSEFKQYLVWRYTAGSGAVNALLIGFPKDDQVIYWCYAFFNLYPYSISSIPKTWSRYKKYFEGPKLFLKANDPNLAKEIINKYYEELQKIILKSPATKGDFYVWKVSSEYEGLPSKNLDEFISKSVTQKPFNSTTYDPTLNLGPFTNPGSDCCLFRILIPRGSHVLYIPEEFHAYPFEKEILLPFNSTFDIKESVKVNFNYIPKEKQPYVIVQDKPYSVGPVNEINQSCPGNIITKPITLFDTIFVN